MYLFQFCPRYTYYFSFFGIIFRLFLFLFFFRIWRIRSIVLLLIFTMHPNTNNTGHIIIPVHMHMGEFITLLSLSLRSFLSYSFLMFINTLPFIIFIYISHSIFIPVLLQFCPRLSTFFTISPHFSIPITPTIYTIIFSIPDILRTPHPPTELFTVTPNPSP